MMLSDDVIGNLRFDNGWCRDFEVEFLGCSQGVVLCFSGDPELPLEDAQRAAFRQFSIKCAELLRGASEALLHYYQEQQPRIRARYVDSEFSKVAPEVCNQEGLRSLVKLKEIFFPEDFGGGRLVFGLLLDCSWDPARGVGIRFEDGALVEIGSQDVVLS